ncbi:hypothetical protein C5C03_00315 [Clavibacter michiganensis]|nr:hypothetical protein C5C03_00315 [Clavibacter michiganensis]PPF99346.1 hypothetical protein C5C05_02120 [Clavibacter michiganensis]
MQIHDAGVRARAEETAEVNACNDALRSEYLMRLYEENIAEVRSLVAKRLGLPEDSPVLEDLDWRIDEDALAKTTFTRSPEGQVTPDSDTRSLMKMRTSLDGMPLIAAPSWASDGARSVHLTAETKLGSVAIVSLSELGKELEQYKRW